jgi:glucose-1-phosphate thymidylyltransferase
VAGRPILGHLLDGLVAAGVRRVVLVVGVMGERIRGFVRRHYAGRDLEAEFVEQPEAKGLGHAVHLAEQAVAGRPLLVLLGDTIVEADLGAVLARGENAIGVREVEDPRRFGVVETRDGRVVRLVEKPEVPPSRLAIVGVYYFRDSPALFAALRDTVREGRRTRGEFQLTDALQAFLDAGHPLETFPVEGWYDCGKTETLLETNRILLERHAAPVTIPGSVVLPPVAVAPGAVVEHAVVGPFVSIGEGTVVRRAIVRDSILYDGARIEDSLLEGSLVGESATVTGAYRKLNLGDSSEARCT